MLTVTAWQVVDAVMVGCVQVGGGGVTLMLMVTKPSPVHPFVDVTVTPYDVVTVCVMVMLCVVCPPAHLYVYGAVPPVAFAVNYQKRKNIELFKCLEKPETLFLSNPQNYIPI